CPRPAVVARLVEIGARVVQLVARRRNVARARIVGGRLDHAHERPFGEITRYTSAPVLSRVIGPPDGPSFAGSFCVRSGLTISQLCPSSTERKTRLPAIHSSRASQRE